jgi:ribosomal protein L10
MFRSINHNSRIIVIRQQSSSYATHPPVFWRKGLTPNSPDRKFSPIKTHLFAQYAAVINSNSLLLLVSLQDVSSDAIRKLRRDLENTAKPKSASNPFGIPKGIQSVDRIPPKLLFVRTHMFLAAMRRDEVVKGARKQTVPLLQGQIAILSLPALDPDHLSAVLKTVDRALPRAANANAASSTKSHENEMLTMPPPGGGGMRRAKAPTEASMTVLGGLVEGQLFLLDGLRDVTRLPTLQTLQAQIVGLLSSPGSQLAAVLSQAAGGRVARVLEGLKQTLEDAQKEG